MKLLGIVGVFFVLVSFVSGQMLLARAELILAEQKGDFGLDEIEIRIRLADLGESTGEAHRFPFIGSEIVLNPTTLAGVSDTALRGLLAHELAHVVYYNQVSYVTLAFFGVRYVLSENVKIKTERATDVATIEAGYGEALIAFKEFKHATASERALETFNRRYLSINETRELMGASSV